MRGLAVRSGRAREVARPGAGQRRLLQRDLVREVMLSAGECETWLTLEELARITRYPPASISAQLRHLRKRRYGGFRLEKRCRASVRRVGKSGRPAGRDLFARGPEWEYRLQRRRAARAALAAAGGAPWA